ncbi:MAG: hypothetical protein SVR94_20305 [Pseudomonadota bacterium]|nr:hypothetical protein [Pseudomonadota bacterium]
MNKELRELYSDYLMSSFSQTAATGLSAALDGQISHDRITRFLSARDFDSKQLWLLVKPVVRQYERDDGIIIFDDIIEEKSYTKASDLICWHPDHSKNWSVKGINKEKRKGTVIKNEWLRQHLETFKHNHLKYRYVMTDRLVFLPGEHDLHSPGFGAAFYHGIEKQPHGGVE